MANDRLIHVSVKQESISQSDLEADLADVLGKFSAGKRTVVERLESEELLNKENQ